MILPGIAGCGKSAPWPFSTKVNLKKAEVFRGSQPPHPVADDGIHGLIAPVGPHESFRLRRCLTVPIALATLLIWPATARALDRVVESLDLPALVEVMRGEGYAVEVREDRFVEWKIEGYRCQMFIADDSESIQFHSSFSDGSATLRKANEWNSTKRYSRCYIDEDGDPHLELDLDLAGGVTGNRIRDFLQTCKVSFTTWFDEVVK
jgi:hypothetical protein